MASPTSQTQLGKQEEEMEAPDRVALWLHNLDITVAANTVNELNERQRERHEPITPPRRLSVFEAPDNISPTETSFSTYSIFDTPSIPQEFLETPSRVEEVIDDESDITSIDGNEPGPGRKLGSLASYDRTSEVESIVESTPQRPLAAHDPSKPRMIWLTSCLQCVLANLPCSRAVPACSRCKRNGHTSTCLLQRRWFAEDIAHNSATNIGHPILLRLKSDDEETWHRKSELAKELLGGWKADQDKKNWILPSIDSIRGHYPIFGSGVKQVHPGEGRGDSKARFKYAPPEACHV